MATSLTLSFFIALFILLSPWGNSSSVAQTIEELKAGVVKITSRVGGQERVGTGFIVKLEEDVAYIVTASHVVEGDAEPLVTFYPKPTQSFASRILGLEGANPQGLAALIVENNLPNNVKSLTLDKTVDFAGTEEIIVIGFPRLAGSAWMVTRATLGGKKGSTLTFTGAVNEGNSGGPLLLTGKVVGVITESQGSFGHAIPSMMAQFALEGWGVNVRKHKSIVRKKAGGQTNSPINPSPCAGAGGEAAVQAFALAFTDVNSLAHFVQDKAHLFSKKGNAVECLHLLTSHLQSERTIVTQGKDNSIPDQSALTFQTSRVEAREEGPSLKTNDLKTSLGPPSQTMKTLDIEIKEVAEKRRILEEELHKKDKEMDELKQKIAELEKERGSRMLYAPVAELPLRQPPESKVERTGGKVGGGKKTVTIDPAVAAARAARERMSLSRTYNLATQKFSPSTPLSLLFSDPRLGQELASTLPALADGDSSVFLASSFSQKADKIVAPIEGDDSSIFQQKTLIREIEDTVRPIIKKIATEKQ